MLVILSFMQVNQRNQLPISIYLHAFAVAELLWEDSSIQYTIQSACRIVDHAIWNCEIEWFSFIV